MAHWSGQHRKKAIFGWLAFALIAFVVGMNVVGQKDISDLDQFSGESGDAERALDRAGLRPVEEVVFVQSDKLTVKDPEFRAAVEDVTGRLSQVAVREERAVAADRRQRGLGRRPRRAGELRDRRRLDGGEGPSRSHPRSRRRRPERSIRTLAVEQFGDASADKAVDAVINDDLAKAGMLSLPVTLIILIITFGTLVAAGLPLLIGITSVMAALGLVAITSHLFPADANLPAVILLIGLAVGVDYSLFYLRREREERAAGRSERAALETAAATSGRAVLISGATVIVAMAGMFISGDKAFISFAEGTILVVAIAMFASLTVLPAMLSWLGDRVEKGRVPLLGRRRPAGESRFWTALTGRVMRRPGLSIVLAGGLLVALAIPALQMKIVTSGIDELPQDLPVIVTYNKVKEVFPTEGVTASVVVEADDVRSGATAAGIADLRAEVKGSDAFLPGTEVIYSDDGTVAQINVPTPGNGTDAPSTNALNDLRDDIIPATVGGVEGTTVNVTGDAAGSEDFANQLNSRLPLIFAFVFGLAFLLMLVTFRSIVIPIKAIILNLLSVGAAYGVLVLVFQNGNGESLLGFSSNGGVTNWLPLFLFVILFGLSMDYHVFILSRVRELYDRGMSTDEAVKQGISTTAGTVTSAAIVMVGVFSVFVTLAFLDFKEMGLGLAVAVLIDATIIRGVLLPAVDEAARRLELVPAELARVAAPDRIRARGAAAAGPRRPARIRRPSGRRAARRPRSRPREAVSHERYAPPPVQRA